MSSRRFAPSALRSSLAALAAVAVVAGGTATAGAAGPAKRPLPDDSPAAVAGHRVHQTAQGATLLITFSDRPTRAVAERRLAGLGRPEPVVPEAGVWRLGRGHAAPAVRARAADRPGVAAAEWSLARGSDQLVDPAPPEAPTVTDPLFARGLQSHLLGPGSPSWNPGLAANGPRPRIAILDSGVDRGHAEWGGPDSPLVAPRSTLHRNADATDWGLSGHGTHVAGIAAAPANGIGVVGVAPAGPGRGEVIPVRIADPDGRSSDETMVAGIRWAVLRGARVVNVSAGGPGYSRAFQDTILWATQRGALIVASVGNDGLEPGPSVVNYPSGYRRVLGVGAQCDGTPSADCPGPFGLARFSNRNMSVDLIAPGVRILSSVPRRVTEDSVAAGYAYKDGTSMAAPYVAGVAALVQAANGNRLSPYQVVRQLQNTARRLEPGGRNNRSGYGLVDPEAAVTRPVPPDDPGEVNDDVKWTGRPVLLTPGRPLRISGSADALHDQEDVYPVAVRAGDRIELTMARRSGLLDLYLWGKGTRSVQTTAFNVRRNLMAFRGGTTRVKRVVHVAERRGVHHVNVYARRGRGDYNLVIAVRRP